MDEYISKGSKAERVMELLFRALKGEALSAQKLADEYNVSTRSITRDIDSLKCFMAERPEVFYGTELVYSSSNHCYTLNMDTLLSNKELAVIAKILVGCRALSKNDLAIILSKLEANTSPEDRFKVKELIQKELMHYAEPGSDCSSVIDYLWKLTQCISSQNIISIYYIRMDRQAVDHRLIPASIMFSDGYFYLIAYKLDKKTNSVQALKPLYFRIDRIKEIVVHRQKYAPDTSTTFDEGLLRNQSHFMWPGPQRHIKFEFTGPSVQAILDKIPTARIVSKETTGIKTTYTIEADTIGDGIKMYLLSQGSWVKVFAPDDLVNIMKEEVSKINELYN